MNSVNDYLEQVSHGKIYSACIENAVGVHRIDPEAVMIIPLRGRAWKKYIISTRLKPEKFTVLPELSPSKKLLESYRKKLLGPDEFEMTYSLEMQQEKSIITIEHLARLSLDGNTIILFGKPRPGSFCHRVVLGKLIARAVRHVSNSRHRAKIKAYAGELIP